LFVHSGVRVILKVLQLLWILLYRFYCWWKSSRIYFKRWL